MPSQVRLVHATLAIGMIAVVSLLPALAHVDDLKARDRQPPYTGPGWCSGGCGKDEGGIAGGPPVQFPASNVQLLAWIPVTVFDPGNTSGNTVEGYVSPSGREYAIMGLSDGTGFVDVTDPGSPVIVEFVPSVDSLWHDVRVFGHYCYNVSEGGGGIQVMDMSNIDSGVVTLVGNVASGATHTVFINPDSGYLYRSGGGSNGLRIYNLNASPTNPPLVGTWPDRYVHEVTVVSYTSGPYAGREIAFACGGSNGGYVNTGVYILDVTDKSNIQQLSYYSYANSWYCHQGWPSDDKQYFYINDELDENNLGISARTRIVNISNLSAPTAAAGLGYFTSGAGAIDHNLYFHEDKIYESNYRSGLRVFDASNPTAPVEIAYFDTWPQDNNTSFNGLWDNYPYLPSGIILGADIEKGLFIWRLGESLLQIEYPNGQPTLLEPSGAELNVTITNMEGQADPATALLHYAVGGGAFVTAPLQWLGGADYRAVFPTLSCGSSVNWYVSVQTTTGVTVRDPAAAPESSYAAFVASSVDLGIEDTLETNTGWTVGAPGDTATTGIWVRADPVGTAAQPEDDHTPAPGVNCFITGNGVPGGAVGANDVDGGATTLTSTILDATQGDNAQIVYHRWYSNNAGGAPGEDTMPVLISNDNGATWTQLELVNENAGAWVRKSFRIADFVTPTAQMRIRFVARDLNSGSVVEAGVDDVRIEYVSCEVAGDITGDGVVDINDLLAVISAWGPCPAPPTACPEDVSPNGFVDIDDLLFVISNWD